MKKKQITEIRILISAVILFSVTVFYFSFDDSNEQNSACYWAKILKPAEFLGNNGDIFALGDGSIWEVTHNNEYRYERYPGLVICPSKNIMIMQERKWEITNVVEEDEELPRHYSLIESYIHAQWDGWKGDTIAKLSNGDSWQQIGPNPSYTNSRPTRRSNQVQVTHYLNGVRLHYVVLYQDFDRNWFMLVEGEDVAVEVSRI